MSSTTTDHLGDPPLELWDQPRIAREFGVAVNTVQSTWRNASLRAVREHVDAALATPGHTRHAARVRAELGEPRQLTRTRWEQVRLTYNLPELVMPSAALPLPDVTIGTKPAWAVASVHAWAGGTDRRAKDGTLCRASPPGRPAGITETRPRAPRAPRVISNVFLTDGSTFIGPYSADDRAGCDSGTRTLRERYGAAQVWAVDAVDESHARAEFLQQRAAGARA